MEKILVSACLLGDKTRYDGKSNKFSFLEELSKKYELVPFCPEVEAGLSIPRSPAEIIRNEVINQEGKNLTKLYNDAAEKAYRVCLFLGIKIAILKDGSPACGPRMIHNGKFDGGKIEGLGVTARYLISKGIKVYCETDNLQFLLGNNEKKKRRSPIKKEENKYYAQPKVEERDFRKRKSPSRPFASKHFKGKDNHFAKQEGKRFNKDKKYSSFSHNPERFEKDEKLHSFSHKKTWNKKKTFANSEKNGSHSYKNNDKKRFSSNKKPFRNSGYRSFKKNAK